MLVIVTNHWKEDLNWLKNSKFEVVVIDKEGCDPSDFTPQHIVPNKGHAILSWFKYIIENYDSLPDHVAFIHGHEDSNHHGHTRPLLEVIEAANIAKYDFISLNNYFKTYPFLNEISLMHIVDYWDKFEFPMPRPPDAAMMVMTPAAQFIVARDRIKAHPKDLYKKWYDMIIESDDEFIPHNLEPLWHIIFGEHYRCPAPDDWFSFPHEQHWHVMRFE
jgi:hypothetical protein